MKERAFRRVAQVDVIESVANDIESGNEVELSLAVVFAFKSRNDAMP